VVTGTEGLPAGRAGAVPAPEAKVGTPVLVLLVWLAGASACLLLLLGSRLTFLLDDWEFLVYRPGLSAESVLRPHGEHIVVLPVLIYKALQATFGMGSALPYRVVSTALFVLSALLFFAYARQRVGQWPALAATVVILFLGAAWEDLLWSFQIVYFGSMAAGIGALLALERDSRRADLLACALLVVAILFSSLGLPFAIGAAVAVLMRPDRWRATYVFLVPAAVYAIWWLGWGHEAESSVTIKHIAETPIYVLDGLASSLTSALGLYKNELAGTAEASGWSRALAVAVIGLAGWRLSLMKRVPPWFWVTLAIAASFWILAGFNQVPGRQPEVSRYQYVGVVFLFLVAADLLAGEIDLSRRLDFKILVPLAALAAISVASNLQNLLDAYDHNYHPVSQLEKADLGAMEIARDTVEPNFALEESVADTGFVHVEAGPWFDAVDRYGSPAWSSAEIASAPAFVRFAADKVLFGALRMGLEPLPAGALGAHAIEPPRWVLSGKAVALGPGCMRLPERIGQLPLFVLTGRGGARLRAGSAPIERIELARFASGGEYPIQIEGLVPGEAGVISIPRDGSRELWKLRLQGGAGAVVCGGTGGSS
jgi:hypothetical protein